MARRQGLVMINTGNGKGKTTAALGAALRAAGQGLKVLILQFIKGGATYGELKGVGYLPGVEIRPLGLGLIGDDDDLAPHRDKARQGWDLARREVLAGDWDLVVLDELCVAMHYGFVSLEEVSALLRERPAELILVITGRYCPDALLAQADTVTRMQAVKHHMDQGLASQAGVEY